MSDIESLASPRPADDTNVVLVVKQLGGKRERRGRERERKRKKERPRGRKRRRRRKREVEDLNPASCT